MGIDMKEMLQVMAVSVVAYMLFAYIVRKIDEMMR